MRDEVFPQVISGLVVPSTPLQADLTVLQDCGPPGEKQPWIFRCFVKWEAVGNGAVEEPQRSGLLRAMLAIGRYTVQGPFHTLDER